MNLTVDWGNTSIKFGFFNGDKLVDNHSINEPLTEEIYSYLATKNFTSSILCSVVKHPKQLENELKKKGDLVIFDHKTPIPIKNKYATPETLGKDRLANAVGGAMKIKNQNVLVVDLGTCNKMDYVDSKGHYLGGLISPGYLMRFEALHQFTDKLPLLPAQKATKLTGDSSKSSIISGVYNGYIAEINGLMDSFTDVYQDFNIILTGGDAIFFDKALKNIKFVDQFLTLFGLNEILKHNAL